MAQLWEQLRGPKVTGVEEGTEGGSRGTGQVTDTRLEVAKDDNQGRAETGGDAEAGGRPDGGDLTVDQTARTGHSSFLQL